MAWSARRFVEAEILAGGGAPRSAATDLPPPRRSQLGGAVLGFFPVPEFVVRRLRLDGFDGDGDGGQIEGDDDDVRWRFFEPSSVDHPSAWGLLPFQGCSGCAGGAAAAMPRYVFFVNGVLEDLLDLCVIFVDLWSVLFIAYGQSKLANILHSNELSRILKEEGVNIIANTVHPGVIATSLFRNRTIVSALMNTVGRIISRSVEQGAATTCYVAMHPQVQGITGRYFGNCNIANPSSQAVDAELAKKLRKFSLQIVSS